MTEEGVSEGFSSSSMSMRTGSYSGMPMGYAIITAPRMRSIASSSILFVSGCFASTCFLDAAAAASSRDLRRVACACGTGASPVRLPMGSLQNVGPRGGSSTPSASAWMSSSSPCLSGGARAVGREVVALGLESLDPQAKVVHLDELLDQILDADLDGGLVEELLLLALALQ